MEDAAGEVLECICSRHTDRIAELEAQVKARDEFIAIAAHELRNPITPISAQVELLLVAAQRAQHQVPIEIHKGLDRLQRAVDAYIRRATTLLDVTRIASDNLRLEPAQLDLSSLMRQLVNAISPLAERAHCRLRLKIQDGISGCWDRTAVEQVVDNLLSNALRYGAGAPVEIELTRDGKQVRLLVRDHGAGISVDDQQRIFERFERAVANRPRSAGFGVGLWVARQLTRAMGGEIAVLSKPGRGATFTVTLPLT